MTELRDTAKPEIKAAVRWSQLGRMLGLMRPYRVRFWGATLALLVGSGLGLLYPQAARFAIDEGIRGGDASRLDTIVLALIGIFCMSAVLVWIRHYLMSWLGERVVTDLRALVFQRVLTLSPGWFYEHRTGELVGRLSSDVTVIEGVIGSQISMALRNVVQLFGGVVLLFVVNARLTLWMLLLVPPLTIGAVLFGWFIRRMSRTVQDRLAEASGQVQESLGAIETVQAFVREPAELERYSVGIEAAFSQALRLIRWRASFMAFVSTAGFIAMAAMLWLGGQEVIAGRISAGELTAFLMYTLMVATALAGVAGLWGALQRAAGATERLFTIIDTVADIRDPDDPVDVPDGGGAVCFEGVSFEYPGRPDHPVLRDIDLVVAPGEVVAVVGPSGAGKSTLIALLYRFFDVTAGVVRLEGVDVRRLRLRSLRASLAVVAQEPVLFSGSLRDNIAYARPNASDAEIIAAATDANAHTFIESFPDGYDTRVGERGVKLSGGQRQRIAIARAILANPRVLILDEATSNLDSESEALVQAALARLMKGRTTIVIAHRLSTIRDADRIVLVDNGRIAEEGTHAQLMAKDGVYQRLIKHQLAEA